MTKQIAFENTSPVDLAGKAPGQQFLLIVGDDDRPEDLYWRRRLAEGSIAPASSTEAVADEPAKKKGKA